MGCVAHAGLVDRKAVRKMSAVAIEVRSGVGVVNGTPRRLGDVGASTGELADVIPFPNIRGSSSGRQAWRPNQSTEGIAHTTPEASSLAKASRGRVSPTSNVAQEVRVPIAVRAARGAVYLLATVVLFALAITAGLALRPAPYSGPTWQHSVAQGESVWSLAAAIGSERALEDVVTDIYALNSLGDGPLMVGQQIILPTD